MDVVLVYVHIILNHLPGHYVHGEVQAVPNKWDGAEEIADAVGRLHLYGRLHDSEKSI